MKSILALLLTAMPLLAFAEDTGTELSGAETVFYDSLIRLGLGMAVMVAMLYAAYYVTRKLPGLPRNQNRTVQVKEITNLSNREKLVVVEADGRRFMLGVAPGRVNMLSELDAVDPAQIEAESPRTSPFEKALAFAKKSQKDDA